MLATAFALAGCGGDGGYGIASTPPPPATPKPTPTPTPAPTPPQIIPAATTSQQFAVAGSAHSYAGIGAPRMDAIDQLQVRYVQSANSYEVQLPHSEAWSAISFTTPGCGCEGYGGDTAFMWLRSRGYQYSRLIDWSDRFMTNYGYEAVGVATPLGGIPTTGTASYSGEILGQSSEFNSGLSVYGGIEMSFDFGAGSLSGSVDPYLEPTDYPIHIAAIGFRDPVYSTGSTTFSGKFDTNLPGLNSFSGLFTGPNAQELIGNFAFPYKSPIDGKTYQADGAFVGAK
jgi:hypothetical protein